MMATVPHFFGLNCTRSDSKLTFGKESTSRKLVKAGLLSVLFRK